MAEDDQDLNRDLYGLFSLPSTATSAEIKKAYKSLALRYHPDKNSQLDAVVKFQQISQYYKILSNPASRAHVSTLLFNF
jgi:DnaJ-class molecular chaperone